MHCLREGPSTLKTEGEAETRHCNSKEKQKWQFRFQCRSSGRKAPRDTEHIYKIRGKNHREDSTQLSVIIKLISYLSVGSKFRDGGGDVIFWP